MLALERCEGAVDHGLEYKKVNHKMNAIQFVGANMDAQQPIVAVGLFPCSVGILDRVIGLEGAFFDHSVHTR